MGIVLFFFIFDVCQKLASCSCIHIPIQNSRTCLISELLNKIFILSAHELYVLPQVHLRKVMHRSRFMRKSAIIPAIMNRIKRDLIHNPLHLIFSVDFLGVTKSTLSSLSKGFAELSTDGQFLQLRSKQVK